MLSKIVEIYNYTPTNQNHQGVYLFKDFGWTSVLASSILHPAPPPQIHAESDLLMENLNVLRGLRISHGELCGDFSYTPDGYRLFPDAFQMIG